MHAQLSVAMYFRSVKFSLKLFIYTDEQKKRYKIFCQVKHVVHKRAARAYHDQNLE